MTRAGMTNLISRLRRMVNDANAEVWTDDQLQDTLDEWRFDILGERLQEYPQVEKIDSATETHYHEFYSRWGNLEEATSGSAYWRLYDSYGESIGTANYIADYIRGRIRFLADQKGSPRYLDARSYDLARAAAMLWRERAGNVAEKYNVDLDGHRLSRAQWFDHCMKMAARFEAESGPLQATLMRFDVEVTG